MYVYVIMLHYILNITQRSYMDILGLTIFIIMFYCTAFVLYSYQLYNILEVYLPNIDLIANIITWTQGPYNIWKNLYVASTYTISQSISQTIINYFALLGLTYIVARESTASKNTISGWSVAFVMLLCTYLLPCKIATAFMNMIYNKCKSNNILHHYASVISTIAGIIVTLIFLFTEITVLAKYRRFLQTFANNILGFPKKIFVAY